MKLLKHFWLLCLAVPSLLLFGCATIDKDANALIVQAERTQKIALATFDAFLRFEFENRASLERVSPDIHKFAEQIRRDGKKWIESAHLLTQTYKANRTEENKFSLMTGLAVLEAALADSRKYIATAAVTPTP